MQSVYFKIYRNHHENFHLWVLLSNRRVKSTYIVWYYILIHLHTFAVIFNYFQKSKSQFQWVGNEFECNKQWSNIILELSIRIYKTAWTYLFFVSRFTYRLKTVLHLMQVREAQTFIRQIEKGRGILGTGSPNNGNRTEGRAGRYDKIETSGTGPCPCFHFVLSLKHSDRGVDYFPNEYSRRSTRRRSARRVRWIRNC